MNGVSGHCETTQKLPEPLQSETFFSPGALALPATFLSAASMSVFLIVLVFLQRNAQLRAMFRLYLGNLCPGPTVCPIIIATLTALLAWTIVITCRRRPGPVWPRVWALCLAVLTTLVAAGLYSGARPGLLSLLHAGAVAGFAGTLTLTPRLLRFHPDSPWVQRIAPLSLSFVLLVILPVTYAMGRATVAAQDRWLQESIKDSGRQTSDLRKCSETGRGCSENKYRNGFNSLVELVNNQPLWDTARTLNQQTAVKEAASELLHAVAGGLSSQQAQQIQQIRNRTSRWSTDPATAGQDVERLNKLNFKYLHELLPVAITLDNVQTAGVAYRRLVDTVIESLAPENTPKLSAPPVRYSRADGPWPLNPSFSTASQRVADYHQHLSRLFRELEAVVDPPEAEPALAPLREYYQQKRQQAWDPRLQAMAESWAEYWLAPLMAQEQPAGRSEPPLARILAMPVIDALAAANLTRLLELTRAQAANLADAGQASNCQPVDYTHEDRYYFSLHCRAYGPGSSPEQTTLKVELRLIYDAARPIPNAARPDRIYFIFPVPPNNDANEFKAEAESALAEARSAVGDTLKRPPVTGLEAFTQGQQYVAMVIRR